jgi:hypothetical protein
MGLGKPVIVTEAPGVTDYIINGVTGVIASRWGNAPARTQDQRRALQTGLVQARIRRIHYMPHGSAQGIGIRRHASVGMSRKPCSVLGKSWKTTRWGSTPQERGKVSTSLLLRTA